MDGSENRGERRYDIDWLRVMAVLLLIYFHTARLFNTREDFYVKNNEFSDGLDTFITFVHQWHMPLFFLVSGAATWFALGFQTGCRYAWERVRRLIVPLAFGAAVIVPPQVYCMRLGGRAYGHSNSYEFHGSYFRFYPHFFDGIAPEGNWEWAHLWFLAYLFVFSMLALPLFLALRKEIGQRLISRLATLCERRRAIFLLAIPLAIIQAALRARWPGWQNLYDDWANFLFYITFFLYGYLLCSDVRFGQALERNRRVSLAMGIISFSAILALRSAGAAPAPDHLIRWALYMVLHGFNSWFWIVAILGFGRKYMNFTNRILRYANEAALPFYIFHQTVIVVIGYYVVRWNMGVTGKYLFITTASLVATVILYDLLVRRTAVTRFLFGMKPEKRTV
jgi:peptidoglycan/LPS O-acetylase OafA/YrhL